MYGDTILLLGTASEDGTPVDIVNEFCRRCRKDRTGEVAEVAAEAFVEAVGLEPE
jgi:hypothetical protein